MCRHYEPKGKHTDNCRWLLWSGRSEDRPVCCKFMPGTKAKTCKEIE